MPSIVDQILEQGAVALNDTFGVSVVLSRGVVSTASFTAEWREDNEEIIGDDGFPVLVRHREYIVKASDVVLSGSTVEPREGDRIEDADNSKNYEALRRSDQPAVELLPGGYRYVIRVKEVK